MKTVIDFKCSKSYQSVEQKATDYAGTLKQHRREYAKAYSILALSIGGFSIEYKVMPSDFETYFHDIEPLMSLEKKERSPLLNIGRMMAEYADPPTYDHKFNVGQLQRLSKASNELQEWAFIEEAENPGSLSQLTNTQIDRMLDAQAFEFNVPRRRKEGKKSKVIYTDISKTLIDLRDSILHNYIKPPEDSLKDLPEYTAEEWEVLSLVLMSSTQVIHELFNDYNRLIMPLIEKAKKEISCEKN